MIKTNGCCPKAGITCGLGPFKWRWQSLVRMGAKVVCIAEAANPLTKVNQLPKFWGHWDRLAKLLVIFGIYNCIRRLYGLTMLL
jgi:hypothetical protein